MAANHETVLRLALVKLSSMGARLFRNEIGLGFQGRVAEEYDDSAGHVVTLLGARRVCYGVCNPGGSDLIGWRPLRITPGMVGQTIAQFVAVECKTDGYATLSKEQKQFLGQVFASGGFPIVARREAEDAVRFSDFTP